MVDTVRPIDGLNALQWRKMSWNSRDGSVIRMTKIAFIDCRCASRDFEACSWRSGANKERL